MLGATVLAAADDDTVMQPAALAVGVAVGGGAESAGMSLLERQLLEQPLLRDQEVPAGFGAAGDNAFVVPDAHAAAFLRFQQMLDPLSRQQSAERQWAQYCALKQ
jgi:hypothetical protein